MQRRSNWWVAASLVATAVVSLVSLAYRYKEEASNKAVGILMEGQALHDLAAASNTSFKEVLVNLRLRGLTGIALTEDSVSDLVDRGELTLAPHPAGDTSGAVEFTGQADALARLAGAIGRRGGMGTDPKKSSLSKIVFDGDTRALKTLSAGIDPGDAADARSIGLVIVARHANVLGAGPAYIREILEDSKSLGATAYLPAGEQVLGQREAVEDTASILADLPMDYLTPEFAKLGGDAKLSALIPERTLRLHSMQQAEIDKSTPTGVVDRYSKAYRERNVRWMLVRPLSQGGPDPLASAGKFLSDLRSAVAQEGGAVKPPRPFNDPGVPRVVFLLIGLSCAPWLFWTGTNFVSDKRIQWVGLFAVLALGVGCWSESIRPYAALIFGVFAPVAAYLLWLRGAKPRPVVFDYLAISSVSLVGGLAVAGLLNGLPYLLEVKQALGVKAILLTPIVLVGWLFLNELTSPKELSGQSIKWGPLLTGLILLGAVLFLIVRSGNDAPSAVSESEIKVRALLDKVFYTRPRTKEILVGHPAFLIGLLLWQRAKASASLKPAAAIALVIGAIGQSDIVDTLCHTHTPLDIGLARVLIGLVVGGMIGLIVWLLGKRFLPRVEGQI